MIYFKYDQLVTVYVEIVIFNNLCIDFLLGLTTCLCRRRKVKKLQQILSAMLGSIVAVCYPLMLTVWQIITKLLLAFVLVGILDKYVSFKDYMTSLVIYVLITYALGGIVYGISNLLGVDIKGYAVLGVLTMSIAILELVVWFVVFKKADQSKEYFDVSVKYKGKTYWLKGFYDTGNTLTDTLTGKPIVLLSKSVVDSFKSQQQMVYDGFVEIKTVNGESSVPIIELDEIKCGKSIYHGFGAITDQNIKDCDLILQNTLKYK